MGAIKHIVGVCACPAIKEGVSLVELLARQPDVDARLEPRPLLPWDGDDHATSDDSFRARLARLKELSKKPMLADVASYYLPHLSRLLATDKAIRAVHVRVEADVVVRAFTLLSEAQPLSYDHWSPMPTPATHRDIDWSRTFPKFSIDQDAKLDTTAPRDRAIRQYVAECDRLADEAAAKFPGRVLSVTVDELATERGVKRVLDFLGIPKRAQVVHLFDASKLPTPPMHERQKLSQAERTDPRRCAVLVPFSTHILPETEKQLRQLEENGYTVRRQAGISAIDQGRSQMATDALLDGFEETLWIDSDMSFDPKDVDRLRSHGEPLISGVYSKKGIRAMASLFMPGTKQVTMGKGGQVIEALYAATGFLLVHRSVYVTIQEQLKLPVCNELFKGRPIIPYFQPMTIPHEDSFWYLGEDYSFSYRARQCGFRVMVDTSIRLWHIGNYTFGWEDAGADVKRFETYTFHFNP